MKIQLTKDKVIEVKMPWENGGGKGAGGKKGASDVVGIELESGDPRGCPAVRLLRKKDGVHVVAAGFVPPPDGQLPETWEETTKQPTWALPVAFQAPHAALAITSKDMYLRQTSADGGAPAPGAPVSADGTRMVSVPLAEDSFVLEAGVPEFQALWLSRLLPEGKRPTASSIQIAPAAVLSSVLQQPAFREADGNALVVYVDKKSIAFAGYREGELILYRECPGGMGHVAIREAVKTRLGLDDSIVDSILDDSLIDPRPVMEPFVRPVLQQLDISLDYLTRRYQMTIPKVILLGLPAGGIYWSQMAAETLKVPLVVGSAFDGCIMPKKPGKVPDDLTLATSQTFLVALGAAQAAMEGRG